jgi:hypothetical protein
MPTSFLEDLRTPAKWKKGIHILTGGRPEQFKKEIVFRANVKLGGLLV